jgi:hypothetical protein
MLMTFSPRTVAVLAGLTEAFDDPDVDFQQTLTRFADQMRLAVPSYLGVSLTMTTARMPTTVDVVDDVMAPDCIRSSLRIPASAAAALMGRGSSRSVGDQEIVMVLYAGVPGALVDLAADLGWLTGLGEADLVLDQHVMGPQAADSTADLNSMVNQAIGVLLGLGETPERAGMIIDERAVAGGISTSVVAAAIIAGLSDRPPPG